MEQQDAVVFAAVLPVENFILLIGKEESGMQPIGGRQGFKNLLFEVRGFWLKLRLVYRNGERT